MAKKYLLRITCILIFAACFGCCLGSNSFKLFFTDHVRDANEEKLIGRWKIIIAHHYLFYVHESEIEGWNDVRMTINDDGTFVIEKPIEVMRNKFGCEKCMSSEVITGKWEVFTYSQVDGIDRKGVFFECDHESKDNAMPVVILADGNEYFLKLIREGADSESPGMIFRRK